MDRFEYLVEVKTDWIMDTPEGWKALQDELNAMGQQGWELASTCSVALSKKSGVWRTWKRKVQ